jgi:hypothetical protein
MPCYALVFATWYSIELVRQTLELVYLLVPLVSVLVLLLNTVSGTGANCC